MKFSTRINPLDIVRSKPDDKGVQWRGEIGGRKCAVIRFLFTWGLLVDFTEDDIGHSYTARYCYSDPLQMLIGVCTWDGIGDPSGEWAKEKVSGRLGPAIVGTEGWPAPARRGKCSRRRRAISAHGADGLPT